MEAAFSRFRPSTSERLSHVQSPLWEEFLNVRISIRDSIFRCRREESWCNMTFPGENVWKLKQFSDFTGNSPKSFTGWLNCLNNHLFVFYFLDKSCSPGLQKHCQEWSDQERDWEKSGIKKRLPQFLTTRIFERWTFPIHRIHNHSEDSVVCFVNTWPLDSNLSGG